MRGKLITSGKTKEIYAVASRPDVVEIVNTDNISKGNGKECIVVPGKGILSTEVTENIYRFLGILGIGNHFLARVDVGNSFCATKLQMLPIECVARRVIGPKSSYRKRNPDCPPGVFRLDQIAVEFYFKDDKNDDPIIQRHGENHYELHPAGQPIGDKGFMVLTKEMLALSDTVSLDSLFEILSSRTWQTFNYLETGYKVLGAELEDLKIEFGLDSKGQIVLGDVIDPDSFRLNYEGVNLDKQLYRDSIIIDDTVAAKLLEKYKLASVLSKKLLNDDLLSRMKDAW